MNSVKRRGREGSAGSAETGDSEVWSAGRKIDLEIMRTQASRLNRGEKRSPARVSEPTVEWLEVKEERPSDEVGDKVTSPPIIEVRVGTYVVSVASGFDKSAFTEVC
jgi:hypothetical protein